MQPGRVCSKFILLPYGFRCYRQLAYLYEWYTLYALPGYATYGSGMR